LDCCGLYGRSGSGTVDSSVYLYYADWLWRAGRDYSDEFEFECATSPNECLGIKHCAFICDVCAAELVRCHYLRYSRVIRGWRDRERDHWRTCMVLVPPWLTVGNSA